MKVLALELSSARGSIAWPGGEEEFPNDRKHSGAFFECLQRILATHGRPERIVVGLGPGSYAGTRIAIAAAIGLQAATAAKLHGLPSICAFPAAEYVVIGDARRQSFFFAAVRDRCCFAGPELMSAEELDSKLEDISLPVFGTETIARFPQVTLAFPAARFLAAMPLDCATHPPLEPIYLREPHITPPRAAKT